MYATVRTITLKTGQRDTFITTWEQVAAPQIRAVPGLQAGYVLAAPEPDTAMIVHFWASEAAMRTWRDSPAHDEAHVQLAAFWVTPPAGADYAVRVQVTPDGVATGGEHE